MEMARISLMEGVLITIGVLWLLGFLRKTVYVPMIIKEVKTDVSSTEKEAVVKTDQHTIYRQKKNPDESYTDYEEIKS